MSPSTGADGRYELPLPEEGTIFVIKPAGFMPPLDPMTRLPRFYRHHFPNGSPASLNLRFEGLAPTGPLPASVDFALKRVDEPKAFDVVMITDPQPENEAEVDFIREDLIEALEGRRRRLRPHRRRYHVRRSLALSAPQRHHRHDRPAVVEHRRQPRPQFRGAGPKPAAARPTSGSSARTITPSSTATRSSSCWTTSTTSGPIRRSPLGAGKYEGRLDEAQLAFIGNVLAHTPPETLIVAIMHIPARTYLGTETYQNLVNRDALFRLIEGRKHTVSFSGHTHTTEHHYFGAADGWNGAEPHHHHVLTALSGSWWSGPFDHRGVASADSRDGTPNGFHILSIDGARYSTRYVPAKEPNGRQMRLSIDSRFHGLSREATIEFRQPRILGSPVPRAALGASTLIANVFDGGERTSVTMRIGDGAPIAMTRQPRPDPFVQEVFFRHERRRSTGSRPTGPRTSGRRDCPATWRRAPTRWRSKRSTNTAGR